MKGKTIVALFFFTIHSYSQCWKQVGAGSMYSIGIAEEGTIWNWGYDATTVDSSIPRQVGNDSDWDTVAIKSGSTMAIKTNGSLWGWGINTEGQLGLGDNSPILIDFPQQIGTESNWINVSAGTDHTVAIKMNGTLWAWGNNIFGQFGDGTTNSSRTPIQISNSNDWKLASAGDHYTIAIKLDGSLWSWGYNSYGQLGDGTDDDKLIPTPIGNDTDWKSIAAGHTHSIAIKTDGTLWGWGQNSLGQLGLGDYNQRYNPVQIGDANDWKYVSTGMGYTMVIKNDGTLWACGDNNSGQFGNNTNEMFNFVLTQIGNDSDWQTVTTGDNHTIALKSDGSLWTTGNNMTGQLGNGSFIDSNSFNNINCPTLGINESVIDNPIIVYPNPANVWMQIETKNNITIEKVTLIDSTGKIILHKDKQDKLNIENLQSGIYILRIESNKNVSHQKLVKQ